MNVKPIAHSYWRRIKAGARTYEATPSTVQEDVRYLARTDVANGIITAQEYQEYIGEAYVE